MASLMLRKYNVKRMLTADEKDFGRAKSALEKGLNIRVELVS